MEASIYLDIEGLARCLPLAARFGALAFVPYDEAPPIVHSGPPRSGRLQYSAEYAEFVRAHHQHSPQRELAVVHVIIAHVVAMQVASQRLHLEPRSECRVVVKLVSVSSGCLVDVDLSCALL